MTTFEMVMRVFSAFAEETKSFLLQSTATGGSTTTIVDSSLSQGDDFFNEMEVEIIEGDTKGERRIVTDFVSSAGTITVDSPFSAAIASGDKYIIGHKGFWGISEVLEYLTDAVNDLKNELIDDVFFRNFASKTTSGYSVAGKNYGETTLPSDIIRPISVYINGQKARIYRLEQARSFDRDPYISAAVLIGAVDIQTTGRTVHFRPKGNVDIVWNYIKESNVTVDSPSDLPSNLHPLIVDNAIARGFEKRQRADLSESYRQRYNKNVKLLNLQAAGRLGIEV